MGTVIVNGHLSYGANAQVLGSNIFRELVCEIIGDAEKKNTSLKDLFKLFIKNHDTMDIEKRYDIDGIIQLFISLTGNSIDKIDASPYYSFPKLGNKKELLVRFVESLFNLWRSKQRFMLRKDSYPVDSHEKLYKEMVLVKTNGELKNLVLRLYRDILINVSDVRLKVLRQLPSGAQCGFLVDDANVNKDLQVKNAGWMYNIPFVWSVVLEPPVIFYTNSNTRRGMNKVVDRPILDKIKLDTENWILFPIHVGLKFIYVIVNKKYLAHAAGLANLFELASFEYVNNKKPDGIYIMGMDNSFFENEKDYNGIVYRENDGTYVALVGDDPSIDYFGYMKKTVLTIHNLIVIDEGNLPIHGAMAEVKLKNGKKVNMMLIGDSGAGKSETLDALLRLSDEVSEVNILIDDMGSLEIIEDGKVAAFGTETGAFVRLDDLQPGYAYSAMDRSVFMNPNLHNARVIVPYSNYTEIIKPTKIDYFFYANNYDEREVPGTEVGFFENIDEAIEVFSKGARMAKGTTQEKGLTTSYFANPFGAIQRQEIHEVIAKKFMNAMSKSGVKVGQIYTQLGRPGYEHEGPMIAARTMLKIIDSREE